jgi:hypothetical protein
VTRIPTPFSAARWRLRLTSASPFFFCSNRQIACRFVEGYLLRAAERRDHWQNPV